VFLHFLLKANFKPSRYHDYNIPAGALVIGEDKTAAALGISRQQLRTAIKKLEGTGEISRKVTNKFTIINICKWESYQDNNKEEQPTNIHQITNKYTSNNQQITTEEERKKERRKEGNNIESGEINSPAPSNKQPTLEERENNFYNEVAQFVGKYNREMLRAFYDYWSEPNKQKNKMRFELQKTWDTGRRLSTWAKREENTMSNNQNFKSNGTRQKNGLTDEEILSAVAAGLGRAAASQQNNNN
jgi:hypothetical protein